MFVGGSVNKVLSLPQSRRIGVAWLASPSASGTLGRAICGGMECITKCIESTGLMGQTSEYGPNMSSWSPLTLQQIRARQQSNTDGPKTYKIGHPSKTPITLRYGWVCQQGLYPDDPDKENQDAFSILPTFQGEEKTILMGVYDGHGEYGDDCSAFVRDNIAEYLSAARKEHHKDLEKSFRSCFRKLNSDMHFQQVRSYMWIPLKPAKCVL